MRRGLVALTLAAACAVPACAAERDEAADDEVLEGTGAVGSETDYRLYAPVVSAAGATPNPNGMVTVLGIRGRGTDGTRHDASARQVYDDTFVVLLPSGRGIVLPGSTHPFQATGVPGVPDVNGDGAADVGRIRPGEYLAVGRGSRQLVAGLPGWDVVTYRGREGRLPGVRDTNHDGVWDAVEDAASLARNDGLTAVLFHHGDRGAPAVVGCQVLPSESLKTLARAVGGAGARFHYVLVDAPPEE